MGAVRYGMQRALRDGISLTVCLRSTCRVPMYVHRPVPYTPIVNAPSCGTGAAPDAALCSAAAAGACELPACTSREARCSCAGRGDVQATPPSSSKCSSRRRRRQLGPVARLQRHGRQQQQRRQQQRQVSGTGVRSARLGGPAMPCGAASESGSALRWRRPWCRRELERRDALAAVVARHVATPPP